MPSTTEKQARMMAGAAHNPGLAKKVGVPQGVAQKFNQADTGSAMLHRAAKAAALRKGKKGPVPAPEATEPGAGF